MTLKKTAAALALTAAAAIGVGAWQLAGSGAQTYNAQAFNATTSAGPSAIFRNVGAAAHWLSYCTTNAAAVKIAIEGSNDGQNWFQISNTGTATGCSVIAASGYFANVRADIYDLASDAGETATLTAYYTASAFPISEAGILATDVIPTSTMPVPTSPTVVTGVSSAPVLVLDNNTYVTDFYTYNPNSTAVYAIAEDTSAPVWMLLRVIPPGSGVDATSDNADFPNGLEVVCSATYPTLTPPATPCTMSLSVRSPQTVNSQVTGLGAAQTEATVGSGGVE